MNVIQVFIPWVFKIAALVADVPDVLVPAVDFFCGLGNGNVVGLCVID